MFRSSAYRGKCSQLQSPSSSSGLDVTHQGFERRLVSMNDGQIRPAVEEDVVDAAVVRPSYDALIGIRDDKTLIERHGVLFVLLGEGRERELGRVITRGGSIFGVDPTTRRAERIVLVGEVAVDMASGELAGEIPVVGRLTSVCPWGLTRSGWILVESRTGTDQQCHVPLQGPLRWIALAPTTGRSTLDQ